MFDELKRKSIFGIGSKKSENIIETSLYVALGAFVAASFMSIALWYENEKRFKLWIEENNP
jgi:hypothetical protein